MEYTKELAALILRGAKITDNREGSKKDENNT